MIPIEKWKTDRAIETVAKHVIKTAVERDLGERWDDYPEIGEFDWERIEAKVTEMLGADNPERFKEAYARLEGRATWRAP